MTFDEITPLVRGKKVFLAAPYSCNDPLKRAYRVSQINSCAAELMGVGAIVFSPVSMTHPISHFMRDCQPHEFWLRQSLSFLPWADTFVILQMQGWNKSSGVAQEHAQAKLLGMEALYLENIWGQTRRGEGYGRV